MRGYKALLQINIEVLLMKLVQKERGIEKILLTYKDTTHMKTKV
jgi:hypothetical protein